MERRIIITKLFTFIIVALLVVTTILSYNFATKINVYRTQCQKLGGIIVHGGGIGICVKTEIKTDEQLS